MTDNGKKGVYTQSGYPGGGTWHPVLTGNKIDAEGKMPREDSDFDRGVLKTVISSEWGTMPRILYRTLYGVDAPGGSWNTPDTFNRWKYNQRLIYRKCGVI